MLPPPFGHLLLRSPKKKKKPPGQNEEKHGTPPNFRKFGKKNHGTRLKNCRSFGVTLVCFSRRGCFSSKKNGPTSPEHLTHRVASASAGTKLPGWANLHSPDSSGSGRRGAWSWIDRNPNMKGISNPNCIGIAMMLQCHQPPPSFFYIKSFFPCFFRCLFFNTKKKKCTVFFFSSSSKAPEVRPSTNIHIFVQQTLPIVQFHLDFLLSKKRKKTLRPKRKTSRCDVFHFSDLLYGFWGKNILSKQLQLSFCKIIVLLLKKKGGRGYWSPLSDWSKNMQKSGLELSVRNPTFPDPFLEGNCNLASSWISNWKNPELWALTGLVRGQDTVTFYINNMISRWCLLPVDQYYLFQGILIPEPHGSEKNYHKAQLCDIFQSWFLLTCLKI